MKFNEEMLLGAIGVSGMKLFCIVDGIGKLFDSVLRKENGFFASVVVTIGGFEGNVDLMTGAPFPLNSPYLANKYVGWVAPYYSTL